MVTMKEVFGIIGGYSLVYGFIAYINGNESIEPIILILSGLINIAIVLVVLIIQEFAKSENKEKERKK